MCFLYHCKITFVLVKLRFTNVEKKKRDDIYFFKIKFLVEPTDHCVVFLLSSWEDGHTTLVGWPTSRHHVHYKDVAKFSWGGCNRVDISLTCNRVNISLTEYFHFYFCFSHPKLIWPLFFNDYMRWNWMISIQIPPYGQIIFNILRFINSYFLLSKSHLVKDVLGVP